MKKTRLLFVLIAFVLSMSITLTACGGNTPNTPPENGDNPPVTDNTDTINTFTFARNGNAYTVTGVTGNNAVVVIPATNEGLPVTTIGESAFAYSRHNEDITSVTIPDSVTTIERNAFYNRSELVTVNISENSLLTTIGNNAFAGNYALESIYIPSGVTSLGDSVFNNCGGLNTITVAENNTVYSGEGNNLIEKATNTILRGTNSSIIPATVTTIAPRAFSRTTATELAIPVTVTTIGNYFIADSGYTTIRYAGTQEQWDAIEKSERMWNYGNRDVEVAFETQSTVTPEPTPTPDPAPSVTPTTSLTYARNGSSYAVTGMTGNETTVIIPAEYEGLPVTVIRESAFAYSRHNESITSVTIPDSITTIERNAFYNRSELVKVNISENSALTTIGNNAFAGNYALESVYIPSGVTNIGDSVFNNCGALNSITVAEENTVYSGESNNLIELATHTLLRGTNISVIPATVTTIAPRAFSRTTATELAIPVTVTTIGNYFIADSAYVTIRYAGTQEQWNAIEKSERMWNYGNRGVNLITEE